MLFINCYLYFSLQDKYAEEIVHMLSVLGVQFRKQQEGLEELACFSEQELGVFRTTVYPSLMEQAHQSLAKLTLAAQWLETDMAFFHSKNADTAALMNLLSVLQGHQSQVERERGVNILYNAH